MAVHTDLNGLCAVFCPTLALSRCRKRERSGRWKASLARGGSAQTQSVEHKVHS